MTEINPSDCIFCKIAGDEAEAEIVYQDDDVVVFPSIQPKADTHLLVVPRDHITSLAHADHDHIEIMGKVMVAAAKVAKQEGFSDLGYKVAMNVGERGGQSVPHIHLHVLAGDGLYDMTG